MLDEIKITSNGVPDNLDNAVRYSLPIDQDSLEIASAVSELLDRVLQNSPTEEQLEKLEERIIELESEVENERDRADIAVDEAENLKEEIDALNDKHAEEIADLEELLFRTEERLKGLISIVEL